MSEQEIFNVVISNIKQIIPGLDAHDFKPHDQLSDLGADSVERAEVATMCLEELSLSVPRVELFGVKNIGELAHLLFVKYQAVQA